MYSLAQAELRLILAKVLVSFEVEMEAESWGWMNGMKNHTLWVKPALKVRLTEAMKEAELKESRDVEISSS